MDTLNNSMSKTEIEAWLRETDPEKLAWLWSMADTTRLCHVGNTVHFRGLLEISNYCVRRCTYCGINQDCHKVARYRMSEKEIMASIQKILEAGCDTVVIQAGEDYGLTREFITKIIQNIKNSTSLAVTLSLGERSYQDLAAWKKTGADRYLLRFETSDQELYRRIHPALVMTESPLQRLVLLQKLHDLGYEVGSGVMVGIPGQTYQTLANDIDYFRKFKLNMIGIGPYIVAPETTLGRDAAKVYAVDIDQVPATELMTLKVVALARLICPTANIPSTTALATIGGLKGYEFALQRGANVVMPNLTPKEYRQHYTIYPNKFGVDATVDNSIINLQERIELLGREIVRGI